ncbi:hypothetical protein [Acetobacter orientalis]|uniref:hypothetical protein n=1 Tax=Acetobacter orientalis TaxID=146474 RepID=UPI000A3D0BBB|nr:hypothetical protein [Acetobacter orientalis]
MLRTPPYLPSFQFHEAHELTCAGNPQQLLQAILTQNLRQDPLIGFFMALRERVPGIFLRRKPPHNTAAAPSPFGLDNFTRLKTTPTHMTLGLVGRFWRPTFGLYPIADLSAFKAFNTPGVAKLVLTFEVEPAPKHTVKLATQTWVYCPDTATRFKMQLYWALIRPASGLIRRRILALAAKQASTTRPL